MLEDQIYRYFKEEDKSVTEDEVCRAFASYSRSSVTEALSSLCRKNKLYVLNTIVGKMYGYDSSEDNEIYSVNTSTGEGMGGLLQALGVFDDYKTLSSQLFSSGPAKSYGIPAPDDKKFMKNSYSERDINEWLGTIEANRVYLNEVKKVALQQLATRIQSMALGSMDVFERYAKLELKEIAQERENLYKQIENALSFVVKGTDNSEWLKGLSAYLQEIVQPELEDMTINGGEFYYSVPIPNIRHYQSAFKISIEGKESALNKKTSNETAGRKDQKAASLRKKTEVSGESKKSAANKKVSKEGKKDAANKKVSKEPAYQIDTEESKEKKKYEELEKEFVSCLESLRNDNEKNAKQVEQAEKAFREISDQYKKEVHAKDDRFESIEKEAENERNAVRDALGDLRIRSNNTLSEIFATKKELDGVFFLNSGKKKDLTQKLESLRKQSRDLGEEIQTTELRLSSIDREKEKQKEEAEEKLLVLEKKKDEKKKELDHLREITLSEKQIAITEKSYREFLSLVRALLKDFHTEFTAKESGKKNLIEKVDKKADELKNRKEKR